MRRRIFYSLLSVSLVACAAFAKTGYSQKANDTAAVGSWSGSWEGDSTGKFEMTITKGADGKLTGSLTANPTDGPGYTAKFKSVEIAGGKLTLKLEDPDGEAEITIEGNLDPAAMKGAYSVRAKEQGEAVDNGTWQAKKK